MGHQILTKYASQDVWDQLVINVRAKQDRAAVKTPTETRNAARQNHIPEPREATNEHFVEQRPAVDSSHKE